MLSFTPLRCIMYYRCGVKARGGNMPNTVLGFVGVGLILTAVYKSARDISPHAMRNNIATFLIGLACVVIDSYLYTESSTTRVWRPGRRKCSNCHRWYTYNPKGLNNHWSNNPRYCPACAKPKH